MHPKFLRLLVPLLLFETVTVDVAPEWGYNEDEPYGPTHWHDVYQVCEDRKQSPIDIESPLLDNSLEKIHFHRYDELPKSLLLLSDGHTARVFPKDIKMTISGGSLGSSYVLDHFHFHWGVNDSLGSEHMIEGKTYPIEIHFVHWNYEKFSNVSEASSMPGGLAVIAVMVEVSKGDSQLNVDLGDLTKSFKDIPFAGNQTNIKPFKIGSLLPKDTRYYRYAGSLTTPPCFESVTWTICKYPIYITHDQAEEFRKFHELINSTRDLDHSNRPIQPTNNRTLSLSPSFNSSGSGQVHFCIFFVAFFMALLGAV